MWIDSRLQKSHLQAFSAIQDGRFDDLKPIFSIDHFCKKLMPQNHELVGGVNSD